jgi:hypothetical protein
VACQAGCVTSLRLLLDHPSADPAAMIMHKLRLGSTALMVAAHKGNEGILRLLLDHPSADATAMMAARTPAGFSALTAAADFAAEASPNDSSRRSYAPLLLLLRRVAAEPQPCADQQAHMSRVLQACHGDQKALLNNDQPDDARDECVRARGKRPGKHRRCVARPPRVLRSGERAAHHQRGRRGPGGCAAAAEGHARRRDVDVLVRLAGTVQMNNFFLQES